MKLKNNNMKRGNMNSEKEYLTTSEAAIYTNRSIDSIRRWLREKPTINKKWDSKLRCWLLKKEDLDNKLNSLNKDGNNGSKPINVDDRRSMNGVNALNEEV